MPTRHKTIILDEDEQDLKAGASVYLAKLVGYLLGVSLEKVLGA